MNHCKESVKSWSPKQYIHLMGLNIKNFGVELSTIFWYLCVYLDVLQVWIPSFDPVLKKRGGGDPKSAQCDSEYSSCKQTIAIPCALDPWSIWTVSEHYGYVFLHNQRYWLLSFYLMIIKVIHVPWEKLIIPFLHHVAPYYTKMRIHKAPALPLPFITDFSVLSSPT